MTRLILLIFFNSQSEPEKMKDVPVDFRHITVREAKRNGFARRKAPSIQDFPESWLPSAA